jgi:hypothetical protein
VLGRELTAAKPYGPFWLILDSLGGSALGAALGMLQAGGTCVTFGVSEAADATFGSPDFFATGGVRLYRLTMFHELMSVERAGARSARSPASSSIASLAARRSCTSVEVYQVWLLSFDGETTNGNIRFGGDGGPNWKNVLHLRWRQALLMFSAGARPTMSIACCRTGRNACRRGCRRWR